MLIQEHKLRAACRGEYGSLECAKFEEALKNSQADPVPVTFDIDLVESKTFLIPRQECEFYAKIVADENRPEAELIEYVNPKMSFWIKMNRIGMCIKLREAIEEYNPKANSGVVIVWPLCAPDQVPLEVAQNYLRKYA